MVTKLAAGWYSHRSVGPRNRKAHYFAPWQANDYFLNSLCGVQAVCASLIDDPSSHQCMKCAKEFIDGQNMD